MSANMRVVLIREVSGLRIELAIRFCSFSIHVKLKIKEKSRLGFGTRQGVGMRGTFKTLDKLDVGMGRGVLNT